MTRYVAGQIKFPGWKQNNKKKVYDAIVASGANGITASDVARATGIGSKNVSSIIHGLKKDGYVAVKGASQSAPPPRNPASNSVPPPRPAGNTANEMLLNILPNLEAALVKKAKESGLTPDMEDAFATYRKCTALAMRPGTAGEGNAALKQALRRIIDLVF